MGDADVAAEHLQIPFSETLHDGPLDHRVEKLPEVGEVDLHSAGKPDRHEIFERIGVDRLVAVAPAGDQIAKRDEIPLCLRLIAVEIAEDRGEIQKFLVSIEEIVLLGVAKAGG